MTKESISNVKTVELKKNKLSVIPNQWSKSDGLGKVRLGDNKLMTFIYIRARGQIHVK